MYSHTIRLFKKNVFLKKMGCTVCVVDKALLMFPRSLFSHVFFHKAQLWLVSMRLYEKNDV